jgi:hypothetical protein
MRAGVLISAISHVLLVLLALLGTPKLFDGTVQSITVDLVRSDEVPEAPPKPEKDKPAAWDLPAEQSPPQSAAPVQSAQPGQSAQSAPENSRQALLKPQAPGSAAAPGPSEAKPAPSIFDPAAIPMLLDLPNSRGKDFDAESTTVANLSSDERAAFRAQLRKCWKLPGGTAQTTRVVLRVYLRRDKRLASEPVLIEASASRDGPVVMQAAMRALKECQPFAFLPADKYGEWKVLDLSFTPRDMGG